MAWSLELAASLELATERSEKGEQEEKREKMIKDRKIPPTHLSSALSISHIDALNEIRQHQLPSEAQTTQATMGRTKSQPKRNARTISIVGAAAHAALASVSAEQVATIVTPLKGEAAGDDKKKRRLKKTNAHQVDEDSGDDIFETATKRDDSVIVSSRKRVKFACDEVTQNNARRRLIFHDSDDEDEASNKNKGGAGERSANESDSIYESVRNISINEAVDGTYIYIASSAYQNAASNSVFELMQFHLHNTMISIVDSGRGNSCHGLGKIILNNSDDLEFLLNHCNRLIMSDNSSLIDISSILRAIEHEFIEVALESKSSYQANVSINLLHFDSVNDEKLAQNLNLSPPIPSPRLLPTSKKNGERKLSKPHSSYVLMQALSGIFKGTIFEDVAKSCFVPGMKTTSQQQLKSRQMKRDEKPVVTAKMVYSVVDNIHAKEFEQTSSVIGNCTSDSKNNLEIPGLVPNLRPYQMAAVRWMVERETGDSAVSQNDEWELCWYVIVQSATELLPQNNRQISSKLSRCEIIPLSEWKRGKSAPDEQQLFCCPFSGWLACTYEDAKYLMFGERGAVYHPKGGMICESMGLGKTVEVIACILANPSPLFAVVTNSEYQTQSSHSDEAVRIYNSKIVIKSRATLIVTPPSILTQWERELARHATNLKVYVYPGMKDLCGSRSSKPHQDYQLVNPRVLADADVVLVTFQTLNNDIGHSDDNPYTGDNGRLRGGKRHIVLPSPLSSIEWHRVCLDEAQRVEAPTTASARMARKLMTERRWCVSGTPIGRHNLHDLYGLFLFLSFKPFCDKDWFMNSFILSQGDTMKRLSHLLRKVMWRSTKQNNSVRQQMGIPEQEERKNLLRFSSIEKYFYNKQYEESMGAVQRWSAVGNTDKLHLALNKLRAACCHPQVGSSGISGRGSRQQGSNSVLSMGEILLKLIDDSKVRVEEAQRLYVMHTNGMACLSKLTAEKSESASAKSKHLEKSFKTYSEVIDMMNKNSSPTALMGSATLKGSPGYLSSGKKVVCDTVEFGWQVKTFDQQNDDKEWSEINFNSSKRVSCVKIRPIATLPNEMRDRAVCWSILQPKECVLQIASASDGRGFVDVGSVTLSKGDEDSEGWREISKFRANKSKSCRIVIKSYHGYPTSSRLSCNYYIGIEVQFFEPRISDDPLQRLHTLHNASMVLSSMLQEEDETKTIDSDNASRLEAMEREVLSLHNNYMSHAHAVHRLRKYQFSISTLARKEINFSDGSNCNWYEDALGWLSLYGSERQQREMCEAVADELKNYYENINSRSGVLELDQVLMRRGHFPGFNNIDGLNAALQLRIQQGEDGNDHCNDDQIMSCLQTVTQLNSDPSTGEVWENSHCRRCRSDWHQTGPVCKHCRLEDDILRLEKWSNDPEIDCVQKAMRKVVKSHSSSEGNSRHKSYLKGLHARANRHFDWQRLLRDEIKTAKAFWRAHFDLLSDIDELNQCKRSMRLRREEENISILTQNEAAFIIDPLNIISEYLDHEAKQALALSEMRRSEDSLRFLMNQNKASQHSSNVCTICLASLSEERSVLSCGHSFHPECVEKLFSKGGRGAIRCPMRCPMTTTRSNLLLATSKSKEDGSRNCRAIEGDFGTKVNRLVGDVMEAIELGEKGIILSQWEDMLDIVAEALKTNNIRYIRPKGGKKFGRDVNLFRSSNCHILLLNVKNGSEGLTLVEANHCYMLEPILNHSIDAQAINRIHRIGQLSKTYIHRYIVVDTVEEKIDAMRMEREANHFDDDIIQEKKDHFDQNEIDQIFG